MLEFFTTAAQEEYDAAIRMKQREIAAEEKRTARIHAKGHVYELHIHKLFIDSKDVWFEF
jgi:hypothetical protein